MWSEHHVSLGRPALWRGFTSDSSGSSSTCVFVRLILKFLQRYHSPCYLAYIRSRRGADWRITAVGARLLLVYRM